MTVGVIERIPPDPIRGRRRPYQATEWHALLAPCKKKRGTWFMVKEPYGTTTAAASTAYDIRSARNGSLPEGRWDATSRGVFLWVRYLGGVKKK